MRPELVISLDDKMFPVSGACSVCHDSMPPRDSHASNSHDQIVYLSEQFKRHLEKKHPTASPMLTRKPPGNEGHSRFRLEGLGFPCVRCQSEFILPGILHLSSRLQFLAAFYFPLRLQLLQVN